MVVRRQIQKNVCISFCLDLPNISGKKVWLCRPLLLCPFIVTVYQQTYRQVYFIFYFVLVLFIWKKNVLKICRVGDVSVRRICKRNYEYVVKGKSGGLGAIALISRWVDQRRADIPPCALDSFTRGPGRGWEEERAGGAHGGEEEEEEEGDTRGGRCKRPPSLRRGGSGAGSHTHTHPTRPPTHSLTYRHIRTHTQTQEHVRACTHVHTRTRIRTHAYASTHIHAGVHVRTCAHTSTRKHARTHTLLNHSGNG